MSLFGTLLLVLACPPDEPRSPLQSLAEMTVHPGCRVELIASEPVISDPISIAFGADGRLWVVEMRDYPLGESDSGQGQIRILEDRNRDGLFDQATVFLDQLSYPNSVLPWKDGAIVCCPPEILFARDTDGDGLADEKTVLFAGLATGNPQHRVNGLRYGLDHWLYFSNGDNGGEISSEQTGDSLALGTYDLRLQPDQGRMERLTGTSQFSRCRDDWGNWFGGNNSTPIWHVVLDDRDLRLGSHALVARRREFIKDPAAKLQTLIPQQRRLNQPEAEQRFTASCGLEIYRSDQLPTYKNGFLVCDPAHQLIHASGLKRHGVTFQERPLGANTHGELLASRDPWFRPVQARTGPDGAIWVVDMYRQTIEHPEYIPRRFHASLDFSAGRGRGRLYRIVSDDVTGNRQPWPNLTQMSNLQLIETLHSENGVLRDLAQQQIIEREDAEILSVLSRLVVESMNPLVRLHAMHILSHFESLTTTALQGLLSDPHPEIRRHAVEKCRHLFKTETGLRETLYSLIDDPSSRVQLKLIGILAGDADEASLNVLAKLAHQRGHDAFVRDAILSIDDKRLPKLLPKLLSHHPIPPSSGPMIGELLLISYRMKNQEALKSGLQAITQSTFSVDTENWQMRALAHWVSGLRQANLSVESLVKDFDESLSESVEQLQQKLNHARSIALDTTVSPEVRRCGLAVLGQFTSEFPEDLSTASRLLRPQEPSMLQTLAVDVLRSVRQRETGHRLLESWSTQSPILRERILEAILKRPDWTRILMEKLEQEDIDVQTLGPKYRQQLVNYRFPDVRRKATELLGQIDEDRERIIADYTASLTLTGDATRGKLHYEKNCASCHETAAREYPLAPHLSELTRREAESLLIAILDPNRSVEPKYQRFRIATESGEIFEGRIGADGEDSISLVDAQGKISIVPRETILSIQSGPSLMPEGLEKEISPEQMADLLAYLIQGT